MSAPIDPTGVLTLLSQERMAWYKKDPNSWRLLSDAEALRRYEDQAALQAKTWVFIGGVEVILRNALHQALTDHYGAWQDEGSAFARVLAPHDAKRLREARHTCETDRARRSRTSGNTTIDRQRNMVMHGGAVRSLALVPTLRTAGPLVGILLDRISASAQAEGKEPLQVAANAAVCLTTARKDRDVAHTISS